jgi:hypothetical protein
MEMNQCPGCVRLTGFKRNLGIGTLIMIVLTAGFWLLLIPFYPKRCIVCGITAGAIRSSESSLPVLLLLGCLGAIALFYPHSYSRPTETHPVESDLPQASEEQNAVSVPTAASVDTSSSRTVEPISVEAPTFFSEYQANEEAANTRYEDRKVAITGVLSGVFVPSIAMSMRMAAKGYEADAYVTMNRPTPDYPGTPIPPDEIVAYSENGSFFGLSNTLAASDPLRVGETVTLVCTCGKGNLVTSPFNGTSGYSVILKNCSRQNNSPSEAPTQRLPQDPTQP